VFDASNKEDESLDHLEKNISMISGVQICAAIANRLPNEQNQLLQAIARINNSLLVKGRPPLLGVVPAIVNPEELPSHGLDQKRKTLPISRQFLMELSSVVARCVDIDELLANASKAPSVMLDGYDYKPVSRRCRIAVSMDNAFGLLFQDNLSYLRFYGADIVPFSPLADVGLPKGVGGIYLTGGFLTEYSDDLMKNASMIRTIRAFQDEGGAIYAEGSSCAYLCKEFRNTDGRTFSAGLGIIPATAEKGDAELRYFRGSLMEESILGSGDLAIHGITNGDWAIKNPERMIRCLRMTREGVGTMLEGFSPSGQVFGTFSFLHWGTNPLVAKNMVEASSVIQFRYS
ncbi:MAG: hypothetical protein SGJ02_11075, partial [bacterium]|nr:hypothetical protein [bacterium]